MMGYLLFSCQLLLLYRVIEKEIYQNSIYFRFRMVFEDRSPNQLHTPYATAYVRVNNNLPS
jgi:hypothetical protein